MTSMLRVLVLALLVAGGTALSGCLDNEDAPEDPTGPTPAPAVTNNTTVDKQVFDGMIICGVGTPVVVLNACAQMDGTANLFTFSAQPGLKTLLVGLEYDPATPGPSDLNLLVETNDGDVVVGPSYTYHNADGGPGYAARIDNADIEADEWKWDNLNGTTELRIRVFPGSGGSVLAQQAFKVHLVQHIGAEAPDDATPFDEAEA